MLMVGEALAENSIYSVRNMVIQKENRFMKFSLMDSKNNKVAGDYPCYIRFKVESEQDFLAAYAIANFPTKTIARHYSETERPVLAEAILNLGKKCFFDVLKREAKVRGVSLPLKPRKT